MNPRMYEGLAAQHLADLHREAVGSQMVAQAREDRQVGGRKPLLSMRHAFNGLATIVRAVRLRVRARATRASA